MRCKVRLDHIGRSLTSLARDGKWSEAEIQELTFRPVYDPDTESENGKFFAATPSGEIKLGVVNAAAVAGLQLGGLYYLDFTPAET